MPGFRATTFIASLCWAATGLATELAEYGGKWIEQADDPLKISLQPLDAEHLEARIRHGRSDRVRSLTLRNNNGQLVDESGTARFTLEHGKLRQLDTPLLVLFVRLQ